MDDKLGQLQDALCSLGSVLVAYSGGVDSTFLLRVAREELGERAQAAIVVSEFSPQGELESALEAARSFGVEPIVVRAKLLQDATLAANPPRRCYYCKRHLFGLLQDLAERRGLGRVIDGSNLDDLADHRPGRQALAELGVPSPLLEAGLGKAEIRHLSRGMGLPTWDRPAMACLASRFPYGFPLTVEALAQVDRAEAFLQGLGLRQRRVRYHGTVARLELDPVDWPLVLAQREQIVAHLRRLGFIYVALDLSGFRSGSANEVLT